MDGSQSDNSANAPSPPGIITTTMPEEKAKDEHEHREVQAHRKMMRVGWAFVVFHLVFVLLLLPFVVLAVAVAILIASQGKDFLAAFGVLMSASGFFVAIFGYFGLGVLPQVGIANSAQDDRHVGVIFHASLWLSIACGVIGALVFYLARYEIIELYAKDSEKDLMIDLCEPAVLAVALGLAPSLAMNVFQSVLNGTGYFVQFAGLAMLASIVTVIAFGVMWSNAQTLTTLSVTGAISGYSFCIFAALYLFGNRNRRERYNLCSWSAFNCSSQKITFSHAGWVSTRSILITLRWLMSTILMTRRGIVYGATFSVLIGLSALPQVFSFAIGEVFYPLFLSRFWGSKDQTVGLQFFTGYFRIGVIWGVLVTCYFCVQGPHGIESMVDGVLDEDHDDEDKIAISVPLFILFLMLGMLRCIVGMYDGGIIAFGEDKFSGIAVLVAIVPYSIIAIAGHSSLDMIFLAEVVFSIGRFCIMHWRLLKIGWEPSQRFPTGINFDPSWQTLVDKLLKQRVGWRRYCPWKLSWLALCYATNCLIKTFHDPTFKSMFFVHRIVYDECPGEHVIKVIGKQAFLSDGTEIKHTRVSM